MGTAHHLLLAALFLLAGGCSWFHDDWDDPYECGYPFEQAAPALPGPASVPYAQPIGPLPPPP